MDEIKCFAVTKTWNGSIKPAEVAYQKSYWYIRRIYNSYNHFNWLLIFIIFKIKTYLQLFISCSVIVKISIALLHLGIIWNLFYNCVWLYKGYHMQKNGIVYNLAVCMKFLIQISNKYLCCSLCSYVIISKCTT